MIITIDGPVASGKTTLARALAHDFDYFYINSGFFYRALAYTLLQAGYSVDQLAQVNAEQIAKKIDLEQLKYTYGKNHEQVWYHEQNLTPHLKEAAVDPASSIIATNPVIRDIVLKKVRALAEHHNVVIDGRDAGSVIFPQAELKIFLTAREEVRAHRWLEVQATLNNRPSLETALQEIKQRDERDKTRKTAPLQVPQNAQVIDSSNLSVPQIVEIVKKQIHV